MILLFLFSSVRSFSTGGADSGIGQTCDAVNPCGPHSYMSGIFTVSKQSVNIYTPLFPHLPTHPPPPTPQCPQGMTKVAAPQAGGTDVGTNLQDSPRNGIYTIRTGDTDDISIDASSYVPGKLTTIHIRTTKRYIHKRIEREGVPGIYACYASPGKNQFEMCGGNDGGSGAVLQRQHVYSPKTTPGSREVP